MSHAWLEETQGLGVQEVGSSRDWSTQVQQDCGSHPQPKWRAGRSSWQGPMGVGDTTETGCRPLGPGLRPRTQVNFIGGGEGKSTC